jgi:ElaB/YqjD/DUF883 family membrane-anchored ribosome-binding protein
MNSKTEELEQQSEAHREKVARLVEELRARVTPGEIVNQLIGDEGGADMARFAARQVREHPLPVALIGAGVAWLLLADALANRRKIPLHDGLDYDEFPESPSRSPGLLGSAGRLARGISEAASRAGHAAFHSSQEATEMTAKKNSSGGSNRIGRAANDQDDYGAETSGRDSQPGFVKSAVNRTQEVATGLARTALDKSGEAISGAAGAVGQTASSLMERTSEMARRTGRAAGNTASQAGSGIGQIAREQPLLVAGVGFALGVALGALLPLTRAEGEVFGEQADRLREKAGDLVSEGYEKVKSVAQNTYQAAVDTVQEQTQNATGKTSGQETASGSEQTYGGDNGGTTNTAYHH